MRPGRERQSFRHGNQGLQIQRARRRPRAETPPRRASTWSTTTHAWSEEGGGDPPGGGGGAQEEEGWTSRAEGAPYAPGEAGCPEQWKGGGITPSATT